jgi:hypothetical protein
LRAAIKELVWLLTIKSILLLPFAFCGMRNNLLVLGAVVLGTVMGRVTAPNYSLVSGAQAEILPTASQLQQAKPRPPRFPGGTGHTDRIKKNDLKKEIDKHRTHHPLSADDPGSFYINRSVIDAILKQKGCTGLRIYRASTNESAPYEPSLLIVGVEKPIGGRLKDQITTYEELVTRSQKECTVGQTDDRCPESCDFDSPYK